MNPMREIRIEKLTLNVGAGKDPNVLTKSIKLLTHIVGVPPVKTITNKRLASWGLRPGLPIGCKITLRKDKANELLGRLLEAKDNTLSESNFDDFGNVSFGIPEYIDIKGVKYDPEIGIIGLMASVTLERRGFRIKKRKKEKRKIPESHKITRKDSVDFMAKNFNVKLKEESEEEEE